MIKSREWLGAGAIAAAVFTAGALELGQLLFFNVDVPAAFVFLGALAVAAGIARWAPGVAVAVAWVAGVIQAVAGVPLLLTEASLAIVLFAAARWGLTATVVAAGLSALFAPILALAWIRLSGVDAGLGGRLLIELLGYTGPGAYGGRLILLGLAMFVIPFLAGLTLRYVATAQREQVARETAEGEAQQAQEIARLQEQQNRLARDVHDVVGHSLTVILAQAESAQYVDDPERLKQTMRTIASSARTSLQDVRQVLTPGTDGTALRTGALEELVESVRASGHTVVSSEVGEARPLPPELAVVAYRVLQEMLTNAIKHGRREAPVFVERHWATDHLLIAVRNLIDEDATEGHGQGLDGMRRRLESVGGRFEVQRRQELQGRTFAATALVPVRPPSSAPPASESSVSGPPTSAPPASGHPA